MSGTKCYDIKVDEEYQRRLREKQQKERDERERKFLEESFSEEKKQVLSGLEESLKISEQKDQYKVKNYLEADKKRVYACLKELEDMNTTLSSPEEYEAKKKEFNELRSNVSNTINDFKAKIGSLEFITVDPVQIEAEENLNGLNVHISSMERSYNELMNKWSAHESIKKIEQEKHFDWKEIKDRYKNKDWESVTRLCKTRKKNLNKIVNELENLEELEKRKTFVKEKFQEALKSAGFHVLESKGKQSDPMRDDLIKAELYKRGFKTITEVKIPLELEDKGYSSHTYHPATGKSLEGNIPIDVCVTDFEKIAEELGKWFSGKITTEIEPKLIPVGSNKKNEEKKDLRVGKNKKTMRKNVSKSF